MADGIIRNSKSGKIRISKLLGFFRFRAPLAFAGELALQSLWQRRCWCSHSIFWRSAS